MFGTIYTQIDVDPTPGLSTDEATAILENASGATLMQNSLPRLTILPTLNGGYALTCRATLSNATTYFVDAHTGQVLVEVNEIKTESAVGVGTGVLGDLKKVSAAAFSAGAGAAFRAQDQLRPAEILTLDTRGDIGALNRLLTGVWSEIDIAVDSGNTWTDAGVVDAHVHTGWTYDYFFKRHNWTGVDDQNGRIFGIVNDFTVLPLNAFFIPPPFGPEGGGNFAFGETGIGTPITPLDVVAHELMHAVTRFSVSRRTGDSPRYHLMFDGVGPDRFEFEGDTFLCEKSTFPISTWGPLPFLCTVDGEFRLTSNHTGAINEAFADMFGTRASRGCLSSC